MSSHQQAVEGGATAAEPRASAHGASWNDQRSGADRRHTDRRRRDRRLTAERVPREKALAVADGAGRLLTADAGGGSRILQAEEARRLAYFEDGTLFIWADEKHSTWTISGIEALRQFGHTVKAAYLVDLDVLTLIYRSGGTNKTHMQREQGNRRELQEILAQCAAGLNTDLHIKAHTGKAGEVFTRDEGQYALVRELEEERARQLMGTFFAAAKDTDAIYNERQYQAAQLTKETGLLPDGVGALRLQFNPTALGGRHLAVRFLYEIAGDGEVGLEALNLPAEQNRQLDAMMAVTEGLNFVSGPMGSGKSTVLNQLLRHIQKVRDGKVNIMTVEDPPEFITPGITQLPVVGADTPEERDEAYVKAIMALLRSDFDVGMIGEVRETRAARLAMRIGAIGRPGWTTIHATSAINTLSRLRDLGVEEYMLFDPEYVPGLVALRLVRLLCDECKVPAPSNGAAGPEVERARRAVAAWGGGAPDLFVRGPGCEACGKAGKPGAGVKGRALVAETILPDSKFMALMQADRKAEARKYWLTDLGGRTLKQGVLEKVSLGLVSPADAELVIGHLDLDRTGVVDAG